MLKLNSKTVDNWQKVLMSYFSRQPEKKVVKGKNNY